MSDTGSYQVTSNSSEDRISDLPESVTSHILSHLHTTEAVQTCVLSTDWKYKWTSINNVDLTDSDDGFVSVQREAVFSDFMEKMTHLSLSQNVRSFSLRCCGHYDLIRMSACISAVLGPNLETFKLFYHWGCVGLEGLLNCTSLKTLQLITPLTFKFPAVHTFPNLVDLHLSYVDILNEDSVTSTIILKFPVLKELTMNECKWSNVKIVEIHAPALTVLSSETNYRVDEKSKYSIKVMGARLSKFITRQGLPDNFIFTGSKVDYAAFYPTAYGIRRDSELYREFALQIRKLLKELWSINYLKISSETADAIELPNLGLCLPRYDKLERIDIEYPVGRHSSLLELLHSAPFLKTLQVEMNSYYPHHNRGHDDVVGSVPSCIVSSLEEFEIKFSELVSDSELYLVKFFIENGKKLKKMHLQFLSHGPSARSFQNRLSKFTKASVHLEIEVSRVQ